MSVVPLLVTVMVSCVTVSSCHTHTLTVDCWSPGGLLLSTALLVLPGLVWSGGWGGGGRGLSLHGGDLQSHH